MKVKDLLPLQDSVVYIFLVVEFTHKVASTASSQAARLSANIVVNKESLWRPWALTDDGAL